ncbi:MAG: hypothetical protein ACOYK6_04220 [Chthoniobacterales bacterium]
MDSIKPINSAEIELISVVRNQSNDSLQSGKFGGHGLGQAESDHVAKHPIKLVGLLSTKTTGTTEVVDGVQGAAVEQGVQQLLPLLTQLNNELSANRKAITGGVEKLKGFITTPPTTGEELKAFVQTLESLYGTEVAKMAIEATKIDNSKADPEDLTRENVISILEKANQLADSVILVIQKNKEQIRDQLVSDFSLDDKSTKEKGQEPTQESVPADSFLESQVRSGMLQVSRWISPIVRGISNTLSNALRGARDGAILGGEVGLNLARVSSRCKQFKPDSNDPHAHNQYVIHYPATHNVLTDKGRIDQHLFQYATHDGYGNDKEKNRYDPHYGCDLLVGLAGGLILGVPGLLVGAITAACLFGDSAVKAKSVSLAANEAVGKTEEMMRMYFFIPVLVATNFQPTAISLGVASAIFGGFAGLLAGGATGWHTEDAEPATNKGVVENKPLATDALDHPVMNETDSKAIQGDVPPSAKENQVDQTKVLINYLKNLRTDITKILEESKTSDDIESVFLDYSPNRVIKII